jgi:hypothetical protein
MPSQANRDLDAPEDDDEAALGAGFLDAMNTLENKKSGPEALKKSRNPPQQKQGSAKI